MINLFILSLPSVSSSLFKVRIGVVNKNVPAVLTKILGVFGDNNLNITQQVGERSRGKGDIFFFLSILVDGSNHSFFYHLSGYHLLFCISHICILHQHSHNAFLHPHNQVNKSRGDVAYNVIDIAAASAQGVEWKEIQQKLTTMEEVQCSNKWHSPLVRIIG